LSYFATPYPRIAVCFLLHDAASPQSSTLPYTTLFRSADDLQRRGAIAVAEADAVLAAFALDVYLHQRGQRIDHAHADAMQAAGEDRKSTRLNSSHVKISYAVFCLKKKTSKSTYPAR